MLVLNENPRHPHVPPDGALARGGNERAHEPVRRVCLAEAISQPALRTGLLDGAVEGSQA